MKRIAIAAIVALTSVNFGAALAASYPSQAIHVVVPWKAGGGTDAIGRGIAKALEGAAGVTVLVDNISGAGGIVGSLQVAQSEPNGYTVLMTGTTDLTAAMTFQDVPVSLDDFKYVCGFYTSPTWILSHKDTGITSLKELLQRAREKPGQLTVGTAGPAGAQMIMAKAIEGIVGVDFRIIPFSGGADLKKALVGNQVDAGIIHAPVMLDEAKKGLINIVGAGLPLDRLTYEPLRDVTTLKDLEIPLKMGITRGFYVPAGTPDEIVNKLGDLCKQAAGSDTFASFGQTFGFEPIWMSGQEFEGLIRSQLKRFKEIYGKYIEG